MSDAAFSELMTALDSPLAIVTTAAAGTRAGCLIGFHAQTSISPAQYCFWLSKANHTYRVSLRSARFAVHFLSTEDLVVARHFGSTSGEDTDKFADLPLATTAEDVPLLAQLPNRMLVERLVMVDDGGDHVGNTCRVIGAAFSPGFTPLRPSHLGDLTPGHSSGERNISPR